MTANAPEPAYIDVDIDGRDWLELGFDAGDIVEQAAQAVLSQARLPSPLTIQHTGMAFSLTSDAAMRRLNRDFRGKDQPTNVLSFAALDDPDWRTQLTANADFHLGDIAFALETLRREAAEQGKTLHDHFAHLAVHGILHLLGYDHEAEDDAVTMEAMEVTILGTLGIADPYAAL